MAGQMIGVVVPCYRVRRHVLEVLSRIGPEVGRIYCVDDACPDASGDYIEANTSDSRVRVLRHASNTGVGGAVMSGYAAAVGDGCEIIVKLDGDGQMDPSLIPMLAAPILAGEVDYSKGNRFYDLRNIRRMPPVRRLGNLALSFMSKASTGYWDVFDPTNGYTAVHANVLGHLPMGGISRRYFFESDMLFRLNILRAAVVDVPMDALYGEEVSNLKESRAIVEFSFKHLRNLLKRIAYSYFLRDLSIASIELVCGSLLCWFGALYGGWHWWKSLQTGLPASVGTVMISALCLILGFQLLLAFLAYDIASVPRRALHPRLRTPATGAGRA